MQPRRRPGRRVKVGRTHLEISARPSFLLLLTRKKYSQRELIRDAGFAAEDQQGRIGLVHQAIISRLLIIAKKTSMCFWKPLKTPARTSLPATVLGQVRVFLIGDQVVPRQSSSLRAGLVRRLHCRCPRGDPRMVQMSRRSPRAILLVPIVPRQVIMFPTCRVSNSRTTRPSPPCRAVAQIEQFRRRGLWLVRMAFPPISLKILIVRANARVSMAAPSTPRSWWSHTPFSGARLPFNRNPLSTVN